MSLLRRTGVFSDAVGSSLARVIVLPAVGIASILASRLVVESAGINGFALFSIFVTLPALIPISDFGISAVVTDSIARFGLSSRQFRTVWGRSQRILWVVASGAIVGGGAMSLSGAWGAVLGVSSNREVNLTAFVIVVIMALGIPLGAAQRILLGARRQVVATLLISAGPIVAFVAVLAISLAGASDYSSFAIAYAAGPLAAQVAIYSVGRSMSKHSTDIVGSGSELPAPSVFAAAWPMAVLALALPLAYQSDRVILSHILGLSAVAEYALVAIFYVPLLSIISMGQQPLWPMFMRAREQGSGIRPIYFRALTIFTGMALLLAIGLILIGPFLSQFVSDGEAQPGWEIYLAFGVLLLIFGFNSASGMLLMDNFGRRIQAVGAIFMLAGKLGLAAALVPNWGVAGTIAATATSALMFMVIPALFVALWRTRRVAIKGKTSV